MAGDVGVPETIVTAPAGAPLALAMISAAGSVLHDYGPSLKIRIGAPPPSALAAGITAIAPSAMAVGNLTPNEQLGFAALKLRESAAYLAQKKRRRFKARSWKRGPTPLHRAERPIIEQKDGSAAPGIAAALAAAPFTARPKRLSGRIAVGIIMVSGPGKRKLVKSQQVKIVAEVQNGLTWLAAQSPARDVTWVHDNQHVTVDVPQPTGPAGDEEERYEHFEGPWRDAALKKLDIARSGLAGVKEYLTKLQTDKNASAAYCAFFTLYRINHFAYCTGPYLVMHYKNDSWGIDNLDRVFAHESGHVFGAPDEYEGSECNCSSRFGFFRKANRNCADCAPDGGVKCIMKDNDWAMCSVTPYHFGYNGLPDKLPKKLAAHTV
jgi:hypothetical protein